MNGVSRATGGREERQTVFDFLGAGVLLEQLLDGALDDFDGLQDPG